MFVWSDLQLVSRDNTKQKNYLYNDIGHLSDLGLDLDIAMFRIWVSKLVAGGRSQNHLQ